MATNENGNIITGEMKAYIAYRDSELLGNIRARSPEAAASRAARNLYGRDVEVRRVSGREGQAGEFRPNTGDPFHVALATGKEAFAQPDEQQGEAKVRQKKLKQHQSENLSLFG
jgi:hypothetical protein